MKKYPLYVHQWATNKLQDVCIRNYGYSNRALHNTLIDTIKKHGDRQNKTTNVKAYMTDYKMHNEPGFKDVVNMALEISNLIAKEKYNNTQMFGIVEDLWGMIYRHGDYAISHDHWPAVFSGVYYIKVPKELKGGELYFPHFNKKIVPSEGLLVIFDGHVQHEVFELKGEGERMAVAFNIRTGWNQSVYENNR